eukprot:gene1532-1789_t
MTLMTNHDNGRDLISFKKFTSFFEKWQKEKSDYDTHAASSICDVATPSNRDAEYPRQYLASLPVHKYFEELQDDFTVPEIPRDQNKSANLWIGSKGQVTPLHHDWSTGDPGMDGFHAIISGRKLFKLFDPTDNHMALRRKREWGLFHHAQVDVERPDLESFPEFATATCLDVVLEQGEMLYIPKLWWHYVRTLEPSISLNFWFQHLGSERLKLTRNWPHMEAYLEAIYSMNVNQEKMVSLLMYFGQGYTQNNKPTHEQAQYYIDNPIELMRLPRFIASFANASNNPLFKGPEAEQLAKDMLSKVKEWIDNRGGGRPQNAKRFTVTNRSVMTDDQPRIVVSNLSADADPLDVMEHLKSKSLMPKLVFRGSEFKNQKLFLTLDRSEDVQSILNLSGSRYGSEKIFIAREDKSSATHNGRGNKQQTQNTGVKQGNTRGNTKRDQTNKMISSIEAHITKTYTLPEQALVDLSYLSTTESINFNDSANLRPLFRIISDKCPKANTITFAHNNISTLAPFALMLKYKLDQFINFDFASNKISDFAELNHLSDLPLRELLFTNNPIAAMPNYRQEVAKRFPDLKFLDGVEIGPSDFPRSPIPPLRPNYCDSVERQNFAFRFLEKYFNTFDKSRPDVVKAYCDESRFTMTFTTDESNRGSTKTYSRSNRNLMKPLDLVTVHTLNTTIVDCFLVPSSLPGAPEALYVIAHGNYTEKTFCTKRSFDRTFVLVPSAPGSESANNGWEAVILSEQLHIRPYVRFPRLEPLGTPSAAPVAAAPLDPSHQEALVKFMAMTSLKDQFALECLGTSGWDFNAALTTFQQYKLETKSCSGLQAYDVSAPITSPQLDDDYIRHIKNQYNILSFSKHLLLDVVDVNFDIDHTLIGRDPSVIVDRWQDMKELFSRKGYRVSVVYNSLANSDLPESLLEILGSIEHLVSIGVRMLLDPFPMSEFLDISKDDFNKSTAKKQLLQILLTHRSTIQKLGIYNDYHLQKEWIYSQDSYPCAASNSLAMEWST